MTETNSQEPTDSQSKNLPPTSNKTTLSASGPIFNVPAVILVLIVAFFAVHILRSNIGDAQNFSIIRHFSFTPAAFWLATGWLDPKDLAVRFQGQFESGLVSLLFLRSALSPETSWLATPVSYAFLHGDWAHVSLNSLWFLAFGSAVARRLGATRFLVFFIVSAAVSALFYGLLNRYSPIPMVGASGVVSAAMAAALLLPFQNSGKFSVTEAYSQPLMPLTSAIRDRRIVATTLVWFLLNGFFAFGFTPGTGGGLASIAWEAHVGGYFSGFILMSLLDKSRLRSA